MEVVDLLDPLEAEAARDLARSDQEIDINPPSHGHRTLAVALLV